MHFFLKAGFGLTASLVLSGVLTETAIAQNISQKPGNEVEDIFACRSEANNLKRLACYDKAVGRFETAQEKGEIVTITKEQVENVEKDSFGFNLPSLPKLGNLFKRNESGRTRKSRETKNALTDPIMTGIEPNSSLEKIKEKQKEKSGNEEVSIATTKATRINEVILIISRTKTIGYNKTRFFMENGQVWEQTDSRTVRIPKVRNNIANKAEIQKASLGSFLLRVNGSGRAIRVRRVR